MSSIKRLVSGAMFGGAILTLAAATVPSQAFALAKWTISCDGNYCCTVNQDNAQVGECWNK